MHKLTALLLKNPHELQSIENAILFRERLQKIGYSEATQKSIDQEKKAVLEFKKLHYETAI